MRYCTAIPAGRPYHVWPMWAVDHEHSDRSGTFVLSDNAMAYCGATVADQDSPHVFSIDPDTFPIRERWREFWFGDGSCPVDSTGTCDLCRQIFRDGLHYDPEWQRAFRIRSGKK